MAGEYLVAAQLQRLKIFSSVTYGNAKSADVIAFHPEYEKVVVIEVKTSSKGRWPIGGRVPRPSNKIWVFVHLPEKIEQCPEFYILTQKQIYDELIPNEIEYLKRYKEKHGTEYGNKPGVASMRKKVAEKYKDNWAVILNALNT